MAVFWDHPSPPGGKGPPPAIRKGAMSDKSALSDLPAGWTGGAPDADAFRAMAEAALASLPDVFKRHIADVVIAIEDIADEAVLASLDIPHPYELTRSEEHTSELQSLMRISYAVFCLNKKKKKN